ncbi:MAG: alanine--tRNA ligase [Planctomycetota bacterium]
MKADDVRRTYLEYFSERGHALVPSSPVVPHGDRTLLFTNAGMNQFKEYFTGKRRPPFRRATTAQKCIRAGGKHNDLDNVGHTARHLTFFEMLGNFSFGDYFKEGAIAFAWELVTKRFGVPPERLWFTVFREDSEARELWRRVAGVPDDRIVGLGEKDNFWSMGDVGPCGPCSEILFDRGDAYGPLDLENGDRFFEIWNLVFMQYEQAADGTRSPLPRPSIDTGMGLERMAMVLQGAGSVFETDLFRPLVRRVEELSGKPYDPGPEGAPHRVLADHARSLVFALADGAEPSNEGRGYVLRRILRRASRYGRKLGCEGPVLAELVGSVVRSLGAAYPEIAGREEFIRRVIRSEEERFGETLDRGIELFEEVRGRLEARGAKVVPGADVFALYDTYGFPVDMVEQMAGEAGLTVDTEGFESLMAAQKERSRGGDLCGPAGESFSGLALDQYPETKFLGYETVAAEAELLAAVEGRDSWRIVLAETPFYGRAGGQVGDTGSIRGPGFAFEVLDTVREEGRFVHLARLLEGSPGEVRPGAAVQARVDAERRAAIARNHTATHLLHAALRKVAGSHVHQKGSLVEPERLRFDVTHFERFRPEELEEAERIVSEKILENLPVESAEIPYEEAIARGAMALFGEKYGDRVRLVRVGEFSLELCGGTHVARTGDIGAFELLGEASVATGVRRVEAMTGLGALALQRKRRASLERLARLLRAPPEALAERVEKLLGENRELKSRKPAPRGETAAEAVRRERFGDVVLASGLIDDADGKALRELYDGLKTESEKLVAALGGRSGGRLSILVAVSPGLVRAGWDAREIFGACAARLGARGGGRPEMVQAGAAAGAAEFEAALGDVRTFLERRAVSL